MSDLRVALRIQAHAGDSRREIGQLNRDLHSAGKQGARSLADESWKVSAAMTRIGTTGAASYKVVREAVRETANASRVLNQESGKTSGEFRKVGASGATSYRVVRESMREAAKAGTGTQFVLTKTAAEFKVMSSAARKAARDAKAELNGAERQGVDPLRQSVDRTEQAFRRMAQNGGRNLRGMKAIAAGVRSEFERIKHAGSSAQGQLAGLGVGVGVVAGLKNSAALDRQLIRTQQTADLTVAQRDEWRGGQWQLAQKYGVEREQVQTGFDTLIASGLSYDQARPSTDAIAQATAVTGADSGTLAKALVTGASAFDIDLSKPGAALDILQKMTVAGRLGNAELENLSSIFPKIGQDAKSAGMDMAQALSFVETLSLIELEPDRLGTLAQSTLRAFNNGNYRKEVTKATGVEFFNKDKSQRDTKDVFLDLQRKYKALKTDKDRARFMDVAFGKMDQDTQKGIKAFLTGDRLEKYAESTKTISGAKPVFEKDLADNVGSATGTASRMKATLGAAIDRMAQPINKELAGMGNYMLNDLELSGEQMLGAGLATGIGGYIAGRGAMAGGSALLKKLMGGPEVLKNIAMGRVLEEAAGVTPVFVTNWAQAGGSPDKDSSDKSEDDSKPDLSSWLSLAATAVSISGATDSSDETQLRHAENSKIHDANQRAWLTAYYRNRIELKKAYPEAEGSWITEQARTLAKQETGMTPSGVKLGVASDWARNVALAGLTKPAQGLDLLREAGPGRNTVGVTPMTPTNAASSSSANAASMLPPGSSPPVAPLAEWASQILNSFGPIPPASASPALSQVGGGGDAEMYRALSEVLRQQISQMGQLVGQPLVIEIRSDSDNVFAEVERRVGIQARRG
ncbi:phage tail tape measure protein [Pseudomonas huaxiensis]|uniref:phage tail tape measure protein n=1 Tax=Pseudomonas huaxiensis TaxID=2213017 RepID=UPI000DA67A4C|nr:phage tail tape measure protein [Pseudomonas huaxiensis]